MDQNTPTDIKDAIYDARQLGTPKMVLLGAQHLFAMFGATVLVPILTGMSIPATLLFAGIGTLLFHFITKWKVPAFLGSSFAFIGGYLSVKAMGAEQGMSETLSLDYASLGIFLSGLVYFLLAGLIRLFGSQRILKYFPPVVTGPIVIAIGLNLGGTAINSCSSNWAIAIVAIVAVVAACIWGRGIVRIVPILLGVIVSYVAAALFNDIVDFTPLHEAEWFGLPISSDATMLAVFNDFDSSFALSAIIAIMPIAFATIVEHIGDVSAISSTTGRNYLYDPGLHRTLTGDGLATSLAAVFGAPANTTYGENTGVLNITKVFDPMVIRIAAVFAILLSFCPKFAALIQCMPAATIGGVSLILYGMISAVGIRNLVESKTDLTISGNLIIVALIIVLSIGINYGLPDGAIKINIGSTTIGLTGIAVASIVGIIANAIIPTDKDDDWTYPKDDEGKFK